MYTKYAYMYLIICSFILVLFLPYLCFLDFTDPKANKVCTRMVAENAGNLMSAVSEILKATESAFMKIPPEARVHFTALNWVKK